MRTSLIFTPAESVGYFVSDETTICEQMPGDNHGLALLLQASTTVWLSLDMKLRVQNGPGTMVLTASTLFCALTSDELALWTTAGGGRPPHPHELQAMQSRGLAGTLPDVIADARAQPMLLANRMKARCAATGASCKLKVTRGHVHLQHAFDSAVAAVEHRFAAA